MVGYLYGGNTGVKTAAELQREREIVDALIARGQRPPQNLGEGLSTLGQAIASRMRRKRLEKDEGAAKEAGTALLSDLFPVPDSPTIAPEPEIQTGPIGGGMSSYQPAPSLAGSAYPTSGPETPPGPADWQQGDMAQSQPVPEPMPVQPAPAMPEPVPTAQTSFPKTERNLESMSSDQLARFMADPRFEHMPKMVQEMVVGRYKMLSDPMNSLNVEEAKLKIENLKNPKLTPAEEANLAFQREKFEFEKAKGDPVWSKLNDGSLFNQATGEVKQVPGVAPAVDLKDVNQIRKEVQDTPQIKNYMQAAPIYRSMVETAPRSTRASDLNLVYGLGKIFDPTSVVREGEMVMVKNTASLPDWYQQAVSVFNGASGLTPELRAKIMDEAKSRMSAYRAEADTLKQQYEGLSQRHGINMDDIWQPLPVLPDFVPADDGWKVLPNGVKIRKKSQ